nr:ECF transporter S component [Atribacterota bacterium]
MNNSTRNITIVGLLVAMSIVLSRVASVRIAIGGVEGIRIGFGKLPIFLGSFMLGPLY